MYGEEYSTSPNLKGIAVWLPYWEAEMTQEKNYEFGGRELALRSGLEWHKNIQFLLLKSRN